jgi:DNA-binding response OmpR family regulator
MSTQSISGEMAMNALVVGDFKDLDRDQVVKAAARADATAVFCPSVAKALSRLRTGHERPLCVLVSGDADVKQLVDGIRDEADLFSIPVLVLLSRLSTEAYRDAYLAGADDVVIAADIGGFTRRLANLYQHANEDRPAATLGRAVVASLSEESRRRLGRTLRQVGFEVSYASSIDEVVRSAQEGQRPAFAVVAGEAPEGALPSSTGLRNVATIAGIPTLFLTGGDAELAKQADDQIADVTGKLLFFADEQAKATFKDRRASARKLYSSICSFREVGALQPTYGVTHNLSLEGMYVRTLDAPRPQSLLWIELHAPVNGTPLHLRAHAVWQRLPGAGKGVLPPGFGLRIHAEQCPPGDVKALADGYEALRA